jgi:hypothetical protein
MNFLMIDLMYLLSVSWKVILQCIVLDKDITLFSKCVTEAGANKLIYSGGGGKFLGTFCTTPPESPNHHNKNTYIFFTLIFPLFLKPQGYCPPP